MIANISPSIQTFEDTRNTLSYANRAKNIKTSVQRNVVNVQYHISNYDQIIKNLKNEIQDLKIQLAKKDFSLNNIIPTKAQDVKNEAKDSIPKQVINTNNSVNNLYFEKSVSELKTHCEEELVLKQKIIDQEQEMNSINTLINKKKINFINNSANNIFNSVNLNTDQTSNLLNNILSNNKESNIINDDLTNINLEEKENLVNLNNNNSLISNIPMKNTSSDNNDISNQQKELEGKYAYLKKNWENNSEKFKEMQKKRDQMMTTFNKNGIKDFHYEYLQSLIKAHNLKIFIIENRFKEKFNYIVSEVKQNYISVLEGQLRIRDDLIKKQNVPLSTDELKSLDQIKNEFSYKLPLILNHKMTKDNNSSIDLNFSSLSSNNLPPINRNHNLNSVLSEIKNVNTNISRMENDPRIKENFLYNNNNINNSNLINAGNSNVNKNKIKNDYIANLNRLDYNSNKYKNAKNYSQGVRSLNMAMIGINGSNTNNTGNNNIYNNGNNNNISSKFNPNDNSPININVNSSVDNTKQQQLINFNQRILQQNKLLSLANAYPRKYKNFNMNLINQKNKDSQSDRSDINNISGDYDSYIFDLDNSKDDSQIRKLKQQIRERKSAQPRSINIKDDSSSIYSPGRKDLQKGIPTQIRKDFDSIPIVKKKDLNNFLVERNKNKNLKKNAFKI